jgi:hypothetical protein
MIFFHILYKFLPFIRRGIYIRGDLLLCEGIKRKGIF